jgi:hypothetical protein
MVLLTQAAGTSIITETIFDRRFSHVNELVRLGAAIEVQGDKAVFTPVKTGIMGETDIEITEGVADGQEIVTGSYRTLRTLKDQARLKVESKGKKS